MNRRECNSCPQVLFLPLAVSCSNDSEVCRELTTTDVQHVTQGPGVTGHQVLPISGAQHFFSRHFAPDFCALAAGGGGATVAPPMARLQIACTVETPSPVHKHASNQRKRRSVGGGGGLPLSLVGHFVVQPILFYKIFFVKLPNSVLQDFTRFIASIVGVIFVARHIAVGHFPATLDSGAPVGPNLGKKNHPAHMCSDIICISHV